MEFGRKVPTFRRKLLSLSSENPEEPATLIVRIVSKIEAVPSPETSENYYTT
jgi:hypothetical protein